MTDYEPGTIDAQACVTSIMRLRPSADPGAVPALIERDRLHMAKRPGLNRKLLPVRLDPDTGEVRSGGAYLFDTRANGEAFAYWTEHEYSIDGVPFLRQPLLLERTAKVWDVVGARDFLPLATQHVVMRYCEWNCSPQIDRRRLEQDWPALSREARAASIWLLHDTARSEMACVHVANRVRAAPVDAPDFASLTALEQAADPLERYRAQGAQPIFSRTSFVFSIWYPITGSKCDRPPLWPNSPPLPRP